MKRLHKIVFIRSYRELNVTNRFKLNDESDACLSNAHSHSQVQLSSAQSVIQRSICRCHRPPSGISPTHRDECTGQACCLCLILIKLSVGCAIPSNSTIQSLNRTHTQGKQRCVCALHTNFEYYIPSSSSMPEWGRLLFGS